MKSSKRDSKTPRKSLRAATAARWAKSRTGHDSDETARARLSRPTPRKVIVWLITSRSNMYRGIAATLGGMVAVLVLSQVGYYVWWNINYDPPVASATGPARELPTPTPEAPGFWWEDDDPAETSTERTGPTYATPGAFWWEEDDDTTATTATPPAPTTAPSPPDVRLPGDETPTTEAAPDDDDTTDPDVGDTDTAAPEEWAEAFITLYLRGATIETGQWIDYLTPLSTPAMLEDLDDTDSNLIVPVAVLAVHEATVDGDTAVSDVDLADGTTVTIHLVLDDTGAWLVDDLTGVGGSE